MWVKKKTMGFDQDACPRRKKKKENVSRSTVHIFLKICQRFHALAKTKILVVLDIQTLRTTGES